MLSLVLDQSKQNQFIDRENHCKAVVMDFLIDKQISSLCPDQSEADVESLVMLHKLTQSL